MDYDSNIMDSFSSQEVESLREVKDFGRLVEILKEKGFGVDQAADFGRCLVDSEMYEQAVALYEGALHLDESGFENAERAHDRAHSFYGFTLMHIAREKPELDARDVGVPVDSVEFEYTHEGKGLRIPAYGNLSNSCSRYFDSMSDQDWKEDVLANAHFNMANKPHSPSNCSYTAKNA